VFISLRDFFGFVQVSFLVLCLGCLCRFVFGSFSSWCVAVFFLSYANIIVVYLVIK